MKCLPYLPVIFLFLVFTPNGKTQSINPSLLKSIWKAHWIAVPNEPAREYGIYHFRKTFDLSNKPAKFIIHVSADNRYKLFVNKNLVALGPARSDMFYWNFETIDIAPYLTAGKNIIASIVWNEAGYRPEAQISDRTAFILQGDSDAEDVVNTNNSWKCIRNRSYQPLTGIGYNTYYVAGPGELVHMNQSIKDWNNISFDDSKWLNGQRIDNGKPKGYPDAFGWMLVPSPLPQMELTMQRLSSTRMKNNVDVPATFPSTRNAVTVPANTNASILVDQSFLTNAYITLNLSGGDNAGISLTYAESPMLKNSSRSIVKPNRNEVEGYKFVGRKDSIISDGTSNQNFTTLSFRTFRYILLNITTKDQPLIIEDLYGTFTGYPFKLNAKLQADNNEMQQMLDIGWRTARACAFETYMDCPYYEQLQYIGDGRIQAMISYYNSGDDRLARNALNQIDHSRIGEGVTLSRHPSFSPQIISTFSLWYIFMLHDYWMYRNDSEFVKNKLNGVRQVLDFFSRYQESDGSLKNLPYWKFTDWIQSEGWHMGQPPVDKDGNSSILDMHLMWTYQQAAQMEDKMGMAVYANMYRNKADQLKNTIQKKYWVAARGLYADTKDKKIFSQPANTLAILSGMVAGSELKSISKKLETDTSLVKCTIYFRYYMHQAMVKGGLGDNYLSWLDVWRDNIKTGLSTWAEISDLKHVRSDCHAWGASPNIEFFRIVLGIDSDAPGFKKIKIEPHLGEIKNISGEMPHPDGMVGVNYSNDAGKWNININIPAITTGVFIWKAKKYTLKGGSNNFKL